MSKHKTAAEWGGRIRDGLKLTMVEVGELVAALAAVEAELVLANNTVTDCETRMADIVAERDDLRRKLEEVVGACQAEAQCYCDGCKRIRAMHAALERRKP